LTLARAYLEADQLGEAVTEYENILMGYYEPNLGRSLFQIVKAHYYLGVAYENSGWVDKAIEQYETFLDIWKNADEGLESVEDAKERLARLKADE
jgi:tetratricopeptide (TPR) repeat protein